jgi:hypothetical protein
MINEMPHIYNKHFIIKERSQVEIHVQKMKTFHCNIGTEKYYRQIDALGNTLKESSPVDVDFMCIG